MTPRRLAALCPAIACLVVAVSAAPSPAQRGGDTTQVKLRIYNSLLPGLSKADARACSQPVCDLVGRQVGGLEVECDIHEGTTTDDLLEFGKKLNAGAYHIGVVWGLEYGWLHEKYPKLKILGVVSDGARDTNASARLWVRKGSPFNKLADLKDKRLAVHKETPLMDQLCLRAAIRKEKFDPKGFLDELEPFSTVRSAVVAVRGGKADCVLMNTQTQVRLRRLQEALADSLVSVWEGPVYPMPVLIGSPEVVDALRKRKGLWADIQKQFFDMHKFPEGKECINFWRFQAFVPVDDAFQREVQDMARRLPVREALTRERE
jgi:ABC-type phosphate/phosphonate transport system substrate-binding protein